MSDKRRCHRINIELPASLSLPQERSDVVLSTMLDISGLGFRVETKIPYEVGQEISVLIGISPEEKITVRAKVSWVKEKEGASGDYVIGLKIVDSMQCDEAKFLQFFVKKFLRSPMDL